MATFFSITQVVLTALALAVPLTAHAATSTASSDPLAINRQIDEEIAKMQTLPGVKEVYDLQKQVNALESQRNEQRNTLVEQMRKLQEADAYKQYQKKVDELNEKRYSEWEVERKAMAEAAKQMYAARHAEIAKLAPGDLPGARDLGFDLLSYPRIDGSTSTQPLAVILACRVLNVPYEWAYPEPSGYPWPRQPALASDNMNIYSGGSAYVGRSLEFSLATSRVQATGGDTRQHRIAAMINGLLTANTDTHAGYVNLIEGKCDVNLSARAPSADETKLAQEKKVDIELVPIARDALVFIVHQKNPVKNLTLDQIKSIYQLKTVKWSDIGGSDKAIRPFLREPNSGSRELFDVMVMRTPTDEDYRRATGELYSYSMSGPYNRITQEAEGLGYSVYYYEHFMALSPYTRNLAINGVEPTPATLANGTYPLTATVYAVLRKSDPATSAGRRLVTYLTSAEGKRLIQEAGYVPAK
jgi:phosphate transport system substrate-binding protein